MAWNSSKETSAPSGASSQDPILLFESDDEAHISGADGAVVVERPTSSESPEIDAPALKKVRREDESEPPASSSSSGAARPGGPPFSGRKQDSERHAPCPIKLFATDSDLQARQVHYETTGTTIHWSYTQCWTLRELLGLDQNPHDTRSVNNNNDIEWLVISNFIINFEFLLQELPELVSIPQVLVIYGHADDPATMEQWKQNHTGRVDFVQRDPSAPPTTTGTINPLSVSMPYGCHHTKLFLVGLAPSPMHHLSRTLRVMVHTSNLRSNDVHAKCQGAFVQDFPWKQELFQTSEFEETLIAYLLTYRYTEKRLWQQQQQQQQQPSTKPKDTAAGTTSDDDAYDDSQPCVLVDQISKYDFSKAMGVLIPSIPGFHKVPSSAVGSSSRALGYLAVHQAIQQHVHAVKKSRSPSKQKQLSASGGSAGSTIVCQFSSIGSLSEKYLQSLWTAWDVHSVLHPPRTMEVTKTGSLLPATKVAGPSRFQLVYPTYREIVESVEGLSGGGSVPGQSKNVQKPFLQPLYRKWTCRRRGAKTIVPPTIINTTMGKGENVPHIKTYYQTVAGDDASMHWFVLGSQNLSKAAWGELQNGMRGPTFKVLHWELGVFVSAETLGVDLLVPFDETRDEDSSTIGRRLCEIPLPYPFRPDRYEAGDTAWMVDRIPH